MFLGYVRGMFGRGNQWRLLAVVLMFGLTDRGSLGWAAEVASVHVQAALQAEVDLNGSKRAELIDTALREDPKSAEAHWARGEVLVGGQWRSLEDSAAEVLSEASILKYWERRAEAGNTVADQLGLADFCRTKGMVGPERAHLAAVVALDPNHREARRRLGQVNQDGVWVERQKLEQQKKKEVASAAYLRRHSKRLMALSMALQDKSKSEERILKELREFDSPLVIPGLEYCFSSVGEAGALCAVETLAAMVAPEASSSLARHALSHPSKVVRSRAIEYLKERDELSYIPELLGALQTPVTKLDGFEPDSSLRSRVVWRRRLTTETQETKRIVDLDQIFQFPNEVRFVFSLRSDLAELVVAEADYELDLVNDAIEEKNEKIMQLLAVTTEDRSPDDSTTRKTPEDWWNWWNNRIETFPSDPKTVAYRYEAKHKQVSSPIEYTAVRNPNVDCLAAGTPIWTVTGPLAVDEVKVGDLVLTQNQQSGELKFAPVLVSTTRPPERLLRLTINNETVRSTGGHLFWVAGKGWTKARSLQPGMGLHAARGFAVIDSVTEEQEPVETYNLIVDECHSYFVGKNLVLSHDNTTCQPVANRVPGLK